MTDNPSRPSEAKRTCRLCGGELAPDTETCKRCGSSANRVGRCSQCQSISAIEPSKDLYWKCSVCGSARLVPTNLEIAPEVQLGLRDATRAYRLSRLTAPLSYAASFAALVGFVLAFAIKGLVQPSDAAAGVIFAFPALMLIASAFGFWKTGKLRTRRERRLADAYKQAILQQMTFMGVASTPGDIAKTFGIESTHSERLLAELNVRDDVSSEVTDDGQIIYSPAALASRAAPMTQPLTERLRVPSEPIRQASDNDPGQVHESEVKTMLSSVEKP